MTNDQIPMIPLSHEDEWGIWADQVKSAIHAGYLDTRLKEIAEACIERNKSLKNKTAMTLVPKTSPPFPVLMESAAQPVPSAMQTSTPQPKPAKKATGRRKIGGQSFSRGSSNFRFIDGKLYEKSAVKGKTMLYEDDNGGRYTLKVTGVGDRSAKVEFIERNGNKVTTGPFVPPAYQGKDPIFMHVSTIQAIINTIQPVEE